MLIYLTGRPVNQLNCDCCDSLALCCTSLKIPVFSRKMLFCSSLSCNYSYLCFDLVFSILKFFVFRYVRMWGDKGIGFCLGKWNSFSNWALIAGVEEHVSEIYFSILNVCSWLFWCFFQLTRNPRASLYSWKLNTWNPILVFCCHTSWFQ